MECSRDSASQPKPTHCPNPEGTFSAALHARRCPTENLQQKRNMEKNERRESMDYKINDLWIWI
jgi:hypothetical protein